MKVTLKQAFSILDGRLSTNIGDVYDILNYIFSANFYTHELPMAMDILKELNPEWFKFGVDLLNNIKAKYETNDFEELMDIIDNFYSEEYIILKKSSWI